MNYMSSPSRKNASDRETREQVDVPCDVHGLERECGQGSPQPVAVEYTAHLGRAVQSCESPRDWPRNEQDGESSWIDPPATEAGRCPSGAAEQVRYGELEGLRDVGESIERLITIFARLFQSPPEAADRESAPNFDSHEIGSNTNKPFGDFA